MTLGPIPHYDFEPARPVDAVANALRQHNWAAYASVDSGVTHLYAARPRDAADVDAEALRGELELPSDLLRSSERVVVDTAGEGSLFEGRTFVDYTGTDPEYFDYIVGGLVAFGERAAASAKQSRLRRLEAMSTASGMVALGIVYMLLHRK